MNADETRDVLTNFQVLDPIRETVGAESPQQASQVRADGA
jgi:hypothetical protein